MFDRDMPLEEPQNYVPQPEAIIKLKNPLRIGFFYRLIWVGLLTAVFPLVAQRVDVKKILRYNVVSKYDQPELEEEFNGHARRIQS